MQVAQIFKIPLACGRAREAEGLTLQPFGVASCHLGTAFGVVSAVGKLPFVGNIYPICPAPGKVIGGVLGYPSLEVVCVVGGENFASGGIVSKMCHFCYLSFLGIVFPLSVIIITQNPLFVKGFCKFFLLFSIEVFFALKGTLKHTIQIHINVAGVVAVLIGIARDKEHSVRGVAKAKTAPVHRFKAQV